MLSEKRDKQAALRFFNKAVGENELLEKVTMDKSGANKAGIDAVNLLLIFVSCMIKNLGRRATEIFPVLISLRVNKFTRATKGKNCILPLGFPIVLTLPQAAEISFFKTIFQITVRQIKYLNNILEQDHRAVKRITKPMMGFKEFHSAEATIAGIE